MTVNALLLHLVMFAILGGAAIYDLQCRRIPNWLTVTLLVTGLAGGVAGGRGVVLKQSMAGLSVGLGITLVFFVIGAVGAGDVKLMMGLGAWTGPAGILTIFVITAVIGLFIAVFIRLFRTRATGEEPLKREALLPYAVPVFMAAVMMQLAALFRWEY